MIRAGANVATFCTTFFTNVATFFNAFSGPKLSTFLCQLFYVEIENCRQGTTYFYQEPDLVFCQFLYLS